MTSKSFGLAVLATVFAAVWSVEEARGKDEDGIVTKPFKISGGGNSVTGLIFDPDAPGTLTSLHNATGTATHLGDYTTKDGKFEITSFDGMTLVGEFHGSVVFVAANGDKIKFDYHASATPESDGTGKIYGEPQADGTVIATFIQEFTPSLVPGDNTGRFAKVTGGSFIMIATSEAVTPDPITGPFAVPFAYTWVGDGALEFAEGDE